jgi:hypothetical protein
VSDKFEHGADEGRPGDAVKPIIMEFPVVLGFAEVGGEMFDDGSRQTLTEKDGLIKEVLPYNCAGCDDCECSNGTILAWKNRRSFEDIGDMIGSRATSQDLIN